MDWFVGKTTESSRIVEETFQGNNTSEKIRKHVVDVIHPSQGYILKNCQIARSLSVDKKLAADSAVLIFQPNDFLAYVIMLMEDPSSSVDMERPENLNVTSPASIDPLNPMSPGEVSIQSYGGSGIYLSNDGDAVLNSGSGIEQLVLSSVNKQAVLQGRDVKICSADDKNVLPEILPSVPNLTIACIRIDSNDNITLSVKDTVTSIVMAKLKINPLGGITAENFQQTKLELDRFGTAKLSSALGSVSSDITGTVEAKNALGSVKISPTGEVESKNALGSVKISPTGEINITGLTIDLGTVTQRLVNETFMTLFNTHFHVIAPLIGGPTSPPTIPMTPVNLTITTKAE